MPYTPHTYFAYKLYRLNQSQTIAERHFDKGHRLQIVKQVAVLVAERKHVIIAPVPALDLLVEDTETKVVHTTIEHFEKYAELAPHLVWPNPTQVTKEQVLALFQRDVHLNNIPLAAFDLVSETNRKGPWPRRPDGHRRGWSLSDNVCSCKHWLLYHLGELYPVFGSDPKRDDNDLIERAAKI